MNKTFHTSKTILGIIISTLIYSCDSIVGNTPNVVDHSKNLVVTDFVFKTENLKKYSFPTHINELVIDRKNSDVSEVFMVIVEPGKSVIHHKHNDTEQVFYMLEGEGKLYIGQEKESFKVSVGDVVRIPFATWHSIESLNNTTVKYLCVDCFGKEPLEPTWDQHVKVVCDNNNWDYDLVTSSIKN